jgi:hypothetical protein
MDYEGQFRIDQDSANENIIFLFHLGKSLALDLGTAKIEEEMGRGWHLYGDFSGRSCSVNYAVENFEEISRSGGSRHPDGKRKIEHVQIVCPRVNVQIDRLWTADREWDYKFVHEDDRTTSKELEQLPRVLESMDLIERG